MPEGQERSECIRRLAVRIRDASRAELAGKSLDAKLRYPYYLLNIDQRLRINFGQPYRIHFYNEDDWAIVEMHIPYLPFKEDA